MFISTVPTQSLSPLATETICHPRSHLHPIFGFTHHLIKGFHSSWLRTAARSPRWMVVLASSGCFCVAFLGTLSKQEVGNPTELREADVLQEHFHASPLQGHSISLLRRQPLPLPHLPATPKNKEGCNSPWKQETLKPMSYMRCSHSLWCYRPSPAVTSQKHHPVLLGLKSPFLCPPNVPCPPQPHPNHFLPWHGFSFIARSAKSTARSPVVWQQNERVLLPLPSA